MKAPAVAPPPKPPPLDLFGTPIRMKKPTKRAPFVYEKTPPLKRLGDGVWVAYSKYISGGPGLLRDSGVTDKHAELYMVNGRAIAVRRRPK